MQAYRKFKKDHPDGPPAQPTVSIPDTESVRYADHAYIHILPWEVCPGYAGLAIMLLCVAVGLNIV